jgi:hypothetical protein
MNQPPQASGDQKQPAESGERRSLGRLRLDAEPLDVQLDRHRAAFYIMVGVTTAIATVFFALFTAFDRPGVGLIIAAVLWVPIVTGAWWDHARLARAVAAYQADDADSRRDEAG